MDDIEADLAGLSVEDKSDGPSVEERQAPEPAKVEAQAYPWMHMTSTLDACFKETESESTTDVRILYISVDCSTHRDALGKHTNRVGRC